MLIVKRLRDTSRRRYDGVPVGNVLREHGVQNIDATACEAEQRLCVALALLPFPIVVGA